MRSIDEKLYDLGYEMEILSNSELIYSREEHGDLHCVYLHKHNGAFCIDSYLVDENSDNRYRNAYCSLTHKELKLFLKRLKQLMSYCRFLQNTIDEINCTYSEPLSFK